MSEDLNARYRRILGKQLVMNGQTWALLQQRGVTEATELRLEFNYNAPDRQSAETLKLALEQETNYQVKVEATGGLFSRRWRVEGSTQPTTISAAILDQWVKWMVTAGLHQNCEFDGWGTEA
jgi:hypothetical protein